MLRCPACLTVVPDNYGGMADHLLKMAAGSDPDHVMWLNRYITKNRVDITELEENLVKFFRTDSPGKWIISQTVSKFFGQTPNPYIEAMQRPSKWTLLGYAYEHHHFLKQWVRSCSLIIANTGREDVQMYEIDNILSEWHGTRDMPSHHELLLRMAESYGISRNEIYGTNPLKQTSDAIDFWDRACRNFTFIEGMAAMHSLELVPNRKMKDYGARIGYFDPRILEDGSVSGESAAFLREGYLADAGHSESALKLIDKYAAELDLTQSCQVLALKSLDKFSDYLMARLQRGNMLENQQH